MKFIDLSGVAFTWDAVAQNPFRTAYAQAMNQPIAVSMNGCFGLLYITEVGNPANSYGAFLVLFDKLGNVCTFRTPDFINNSVNNVTIVEPWNVEINGNLINWVLNNNPATFSWRIPNVFSPGATYVVPYGVFTPLNPCSAGNFSHPIYLNQQGLTAYEYIGSVGQTGYYYASIYDANHNFVNGGFIDSNSSGQDPFDQSTVTLPPFTYSSDVYYRNGYRFYTSGGGGAPVYQVIGIYLPYLNGDYLALNCGSASPSVNVTNKSGVEIFPYRDWNMPAFRSRSFAIPQGITDIDGQFVLIDNPTRVFTANYFIDTPFVLNPNTASMGYIKNQGLWFLHVGGGPNASQGSTVYISSIPLDLSAYGPPPNVNQSAFKGLANYHRAVSPSGMFQA